MALYSTKESAGAFSGLSPLVTSPVLGELLGPCAPLPSPIAAQVWTPTAKHRLSPPISGLDAADLGQTGPDSARGHFAVSCIHRGCSC